MGKIKFDKEQLVSDNSDIKDLIEIYCDACETYNEAQDNIERNGAVSAHPRTGAPMENPYLKVRASSAVTIERIRKSLNNTGDDGGLI